MNTQTNHGAAIPLPEPSGSTWISQDPDDPPIVYCMPCREEGCICPVEFCRKHREERLRRIERQYPGYLP